MSQILLRALTESSFRADAIVCGAVDGMPLGQPDYLEKMAHALLTHLIFGDRGADLGLARSFAQTFALLASEAGLKPFDLGRRFMESEFYAAAGESPGEVHALCFEEAFLRYIQASAFSQNVKQTAHAEAMLALGSILALNPSPCFALGRDLFRPFSKGWIGCMSASSGTLAWVALHGKLVRAKIRAADPFAALEKNYG